MFKTNNTMPFKLAFYLGLFLFPIHCYALKIIPENLEVKFPGLHLTGVGKNVVSKPDNNQLYVVRFHVEGTPGKRIFVSVPNDQYLQHETDSSRVKIRRIFYGCGLSKRGRTKLKSDGKSKMLCIGAKIRLGKNHSAGRYSGTIPFEVNYK